MANSRSAEKSARVTARKTVINRRVTSALRTQVKDARKALQAKDVAEAQKSTRQAVSALDKAGTRGYIHPNKASRTTSRLLRHLNKMMGEAVSTEKPKRATRRRTTTKSKS